MFHKALSFPSKFLNHRFELVALDDVADEIFAEIAELDSAFQTGADFFHIVLKTAERRKSAVVNRLTFTNDTRATRASDSTVGNQTARDDAFAQLEDLFHFGVTEDRFTEFRIEQSGHRVPHLIEQFVNDAVELDLNAFAFRRRNSHVFNLRVEA